MSPFMIPIWCNRVSVPCLFDWIEPVNAFIQPPIHLEQRNSLMQIPYSVSAMIDA